jgi:uncharacterized delta-60 repeat protein
MLDRGLLPAMRSRRTARAGRPRPPPRASSIDGAAVTGAGRTRASSIAATYPSRRARFHAPDTGPSIFHRLKRAPTRTDTVVMRPFAYLHALTPARGMLVLALVAWAIAAAVASEASLGTATAATGSVVVGATVPSATEMSMLGCQSGVAGTTSFGTLLPGASAVTTTDCTVSFGSSNNTSQLQVRQSDGSGVAMHAAPTGALDGGFGTAGRYVKASAMETDVYSAIPGPNGSMFTFGERCGSCDATVAKVTEAGAMDLSWSGDGFAATLDSTDRVYANGVLLPDGDVLAVGYWAGASRDLYATRFNSDGSVDTTWGTNGSVTQVTAGTSDIYHQVVAAPGDRLYLSGFRGSTAFIERRYADSFALDPTFGTGGVQSFTWTPGQDNWIERIKVRPDGSLVALGFTYNGVGYTAKVLSMTSTGTPTVGFGTAGAVTISTDYHDETFGTDGDLELQSDGKIVVGLLENWPMDWVVRRLAASTGAPDSSWGTAGVATIPTGGVGHDSISDLLAQADGTLYVAGSAAGLDETVARVRSDGTLDTSFGGGDGRITMPGVTDGGPLHLVPIGDGQVAMAIARGNSGTSTEQKKLYVEALSNTPLADYGGANVWANTNDLFAACLHGVTGSGVTASWTPDATCGLTDGAWWRAVPATPSTIATSNTPGTTNGTASLRFGIKTPSSFAAGSYSADITFSVLAP